MKKIIAAFDGLKFSVSTQQHALDIAPNDSLLVGVFLDDFTHHSFKLTDMVGDEGVSSEKIRQLVEKDARVSLATNDSYKNDKGERVEETQWHNLVMWDKTAVFAENYLHKGTEVSIEGRLTNRVYTDKAGVKKYFTEVVVNVIMQAPEF